MSQPKRIFIVGHSGAGKGVLAQALAKKLNWKFIDADFSLATTIGRDTKEILTSAGENAFFQCLSQVLSHQIEQENIVVTTDDSIVCLERNRQILSSEFVVYLEVNPNIQLERISHNRPLLPVKNYKEFLSQLRQERDELYKQVASFSISSDNGDIEEHVINILSFIKS